jgi:hypothetical protein
MPDKSLVDVERCRTTIGCSQLVKSLVSGTRVSWRKWHVALAYGYPKPGYPFTVSTFDLELNALRQVREAGDVTR